MYRAKTGVPVRVPLPAEVAKLLHSLPSTNPNFFFWTGNGDPETPKKGWLAVELLLSGVPNDQVSLLLGHSSVMVTEKHYALFVKARQEQLENSVKLSWQVHSEWLNQSAPAAVHIN